MVAHTKLMSRGYQGLRGAKGDPGEIGLLAFDLDPETGDLTVTSSESMDEQVGFGIDDGGNLILDIQN